MANSILELFASEVQLTTTGLNSLASSSALVGIQTNMVDLTAIKVPVVHVVFSIKAGTSPTVGNVYFRLLRQNTGGTTVRTDGASSTSGALTAVGAPLIWTAPSKPSPATGDVISGMFPIYDPGPWFGLHISQDMGVATDSTAGNHYVAYIADNPQVQ